MKSALLSFLSWFLPTVLCASPSVQGAGPARGEFGVPGRLSRGRVWSERGADGQLRTMTSVSLDGERFSPARVTRYELELRYRRFDPLTDEPEIPGSLRAQPDNRLFVVQYWTQGLEDYRDALRE